MPLPMQISELLYRTGFKNFRVWFAEDPHHLSQRLSEFARRILGRVLPFGNEVMYPHRIVIFGINERQVDRNCIHWPTGLAVVVADDQEVSEPVHSFV